MTGFDNIMRSQEMVARDAQIRDQQKYDAMEGQGAALRDFGDRMQRNREQSLQEAQFKMQYQAFAQRLAMEQADASMALQQHQQQFQLNAIKLQTMQAVDQTDLMRAQVEQAQTAAKMSKLQYTAAEEEHRERSARRSEDIEAKLVQALGGANDMWKSNLMFDVSQPSGQRLRKMTADERVEAERMAGGTVEARRREAENRLQENARLTRAKDLRELAMEETDRTKQARLNAMADAELEALGVGGAPALQSPRSPTVDRALVDSTAQKITAYVPTPKTGSDGPLAAPGLMNLTPMFDESTKTRIAEALWNEADTLMAAQQQGFDRDPNRKGLRATRESAVDEFVSILNNPNHPKRDAVIAILRSQGIVK